MNNKVLIYDLNYFDSIISNYDKIVKKILPIIHIPQYSYYLIKSKYDNNQKELINKFIQEKYLKIEDIDCDSTEYETFIKLKKGINCQCRSKSESIAITLAKHSDFIVLTKNNDSFKEFDISTITINNLILNSFNNKSITLEEAEELWTCLGKCMDNCEYGSFKEFLENS